MSSIDSVSSSSDTSQTGTVPNFQQIKSDFQALASALQSGNVSSAQQAYAALQKDAPGLFQSNSSQGSSSSDPLASALSSLGTALQSGNLANSQQAFAALQQTVQGHHHHHHKGGDDQSPAVTVGSDETQASSSSTSSSTGFSALA
jgi:hypothetical protein